MYNKIQNMIKESNACRFYGGVSEAEINNAEKVLGVIFPISYRRFLKDYGVGTIGYDEILGITKNNKGWPSVIWNTLEERVNGEMPRELIPVYLYEDEFYFCIDTSMCINGECPIVAIDIGDSAGERKKTYDSFDELLLKILNNNIV